MDLGKRFFQKPKRIKARTTSFLGSIKRWCSSALGKVDVALVDPIEALVDKLEGGDSRYNLKLEEINFQVNVKISFTFY